MTHPIFISYRRSDSQYAAFAIADRLRWSFGREQVFLDRGEIQPGAPWPATIKEALMAAKVVLVIIGPEWLRTADAWGRRRLDDPQDWVRAEVCTALERQAAGATQVVPVLLEGASLPPREAQAVDVGLQPLLGLQARQLHNDNWAVDLESLLSRVAALGNLPRQTLPGDQRHANGAPARPYPKQTKWSTMADEDVRRKLAPLGSWQLQWSEHPWGAGGLAQEIAKTYDFPSFVGAVEFMRAAALEIETWRPPHHPRWENQWKVVTARFSTWDVDCRVTELDIAAARKLDQLFFKHR